MKIQSAKAGIGTGRAGLQAASGLFSSAGLFQKGVKSFNPLSLDPYLLFDAETSMRGTLEAFTLDLDPANPSTLDVITATRAGIATVTSASGTVVAASPNTVRVDYSLGYPAILVEPSSENLVTHSDFSGGWQEYLINSSAGGGYASQPSRVITSTGVNAAYIISVATSNGVSYTASIWARRVSGSGGCNIIYISSPTAKQSISLTSEFQKFTATFTGKSGGGNVTFGVDIVTAGDSIEIAMPQVEVGAVATSFIPTSGGNAAARTRAADDLKITGSAFTDFFSSSEGTFYAEYQFNDADGANSLIYGEYDSHRFAYKNLGSASPLLSWDGTNVLNYGRLAAGTLLRTALSYNSNSMEGSQDGSAATMSNQTAPFPHTGNFLTASKLHIGSDTNGGKQLNGQIKRLIYWPTVSGRL
jgi:hypothetical protein